LRCQPDDPTPTPCVVWNRGHYLQEDGGRTRSGSCQLVATAALQVEEPSVLFTSEHPLGENMRSINKAVAAGLAASMLVLATPSVFAYWWSPSAFTEERTLKLGMRCRGERERRLSERFVVLGGMVYVRLSRREAAIVQCNGMAPLLAVEVARQRFESVRGTPAPEFAERVDKAMADKYITDILVRFFPHPLTLRLVPGY